MVAALVPVTRASTQIGQCGTIVCPEIPYPGRDHGARALFQVSCFRSRIPPEMTYSRSPARRTGSTHGKLMRYTLAVTH